MTVGAFVGLAASSQPPGERRVSECREGCLRPLAALSFLEPRAGYRVCDLAAPALESGQSPLGCPVPMWTASFFGTTGRVTAFPLHHPEGAAVNEPPSRAVILLFGSPLFLPKPNDG